LRNAWLPTISKYKFNINVPTSLHDKLLKVSFTNTIKQIILKTEIGVLDSTRDCIPGIYISEGVSISSVFSYKIGTNLIFLF
jgi:hypothetical protein